MAEGYKFPQTQNLINKFINEIKQTPDFTERTKCTYLRDYRSFLLSVFAEIDIATIDRDSLGQKLSEFTASYSGVRLSDTFSCVRKFIFFLIDTKYYEDGRFNFLQYYEPYFSYGNSFLINILLRKVYQHDCTAEIVSSFLCSILDDNNHAETTKRALYSEAKKYLMMILHDTDIQNADRFQLGRALESITSDLPDKEQILAQKAFRRFLYFLIDQNFFTDKRLEYLQYYRSFLDTTTRLKISRILLSACYFRYRIATLQNSRTLLIYVGSDSEDVCNAVGEAFGIFTHPFEDVKSFIANFDNSLFPYEVTTVSDFTWHTFLAQCEYLRKRKASRYAYAYLITLYNLVAQKYNSLLFNDVRIPPAVLTRQNLSELLHKGYELIPYNPNENAPAGDKLIICLTQDSCRTNTTQYQTSSKAIDFSSISAPEYRHLLKDYLWHAAPSLEAKINACFHAKLFLNYIHALRNKKELSIYYIPHNDIRIEPGECMAYVQHTKQLYRNTKTTYAYIAAARLVMQYAIDMKYDWVNPKSTFYLSSYTDIANSANPLNDEDLYTLSKVINKKAQESTLNALMACIYYLLLTTEFRISQVIALRKNCVRPAMKRNEYVLISTHKTSNGEQVETPITLETKKHIDFILSLTENYRMQCCDKSIVDRLFIIPSLRKHTYTTITEQRFNTYLSSCCCEAGTQRYTASNLRDTHMTKAEEVCIRNKMSDMEKLILSGHATTATSERHYIKDEIVALLEASYGIIIGDIQLEGSVSENHVEAPDGATVANQCGFCGKNACESYSYLSCLMCKHFIATRAQIPFFNAEIARIEAKIQSLTIPHDIEDLRNIQRLLLAYLSQLLRKEDIHVLNS